MIRFNASLETVNSQLLVVLPRDASAALPSRGMTMVEGVLSGVKLLAPLEPDGRGSHWLAVSDPLRESANLADGDTVQLEIEPVKDWPEPAVPGDLQSALDGDADVYELWRDITPMARWDWIRWIRSTHNPQTRAKRIGVAFSKLRKGDRRPCCFNRTMCTDPAVSKSGVLLQAGR